MSVPTYDTVDTLPIAVIDELAEGVVPTSSQQENTQLNIPPHPQTRRWYNNTGYWSDMDFHPDLRLPDCCPYSMGMSVTFEAKGRESVLVCLSTTTQFDLGKAYAVEIGSGGNCKVSIRRRLEEGGEKQTERVTGRVVDPGHFNAYWICAIDGAVHCGMGTEVGRNTLCKMDDSLYEQLRSGTDAPKYVGFGNAARGKQERKDSGGKRVTIRNIVVAGCPPTQTIEDVEEGGDFADAKGILKFSEYSADDEADNRRYLIEWQEECRKSKARAEKFGLEYKDPEPEQFLKWSEAKRLRENPNKGFTTGFDLNTEEEEKKRQARKERFKRKKPDGDDDAMDNDGEEGEDEDEGPYWKNKKPSVEPREAWANFHTLKHWRVDAFEGKDELQKNKLIEQALKRKAAREREAAARAAANEEKDEKQADDMEGEEKADNNDGNDEADMADSEVNNDGSKVINDDELDEDGNLKAPWETIKKDTKKIHIFALDMAAFKQMRTEDIMSHFRNFGPSYVEWLGEYACNILFEDEFSASRAIMNMSQSIATKEEMEVWDKNNQEEYERRKEEYRQSKAAQKEEEKRKRLLEGGLITGAGTTNTNDDDIQEECETNDDAGMDDEGADLAEERPARVDLNGMGWKICNNPIWKIANDHHGRKGTRARFICRYGTSYDTLQYRPGDEDKPRIPRGFSRDLVLGKYTGTRRDPNSNNNKRRKRDRQQQESKNYDNSFDDRKRAKGGYYDAPSMMDSALSSSR